MVEPELEELKELEYRSPHVCALNHDQCQVQQEELLKPDLLVGEYMCIYSLGLRPCDRENTRLRLHPRTTRPDTKIIKKK